MPRPSQVQHKRVQAPAKNIPRRRSKNHQPPLQKGVRSSVQPRAPSVRQPRHTNTPPKLSAICTAKLKSLSLETNHYKEFSEASEGDSQAPEIVFRDTFFFDSKVTDDTKATPWQSVYIDDSELTWSGTTSASHMGTIPLRGRLSVREASAAAAAENLTPIVMSGILGTSAERAGDLHGSCSRLVPRTDDMKWCNVGSWDYKKMSAEGFTFSTASNRPSAFEACRFLIIDSDSGTPVSGPLQFMFQYEVAVNLPPMTFVNLGFSQQAGVTDIQAPTFTEHPALVKPYALRNLD